MLIAITVLLIIVLIVQISKIAELASILKGEENAIEERNKTNAFLMIVFLILGLFGLFYSVYQYWDFFLPEASSIHGVWIDNMFNITLLLTGIVFFITQILTFYFAYKYRQRKGTKAYFYPENHKLEMLWTVIPTIVLTALVAYGIYKWDKITTIAAPGTPVVEVTGKQFAWMIRYPGMDGKLGKRVFKLTSGINGLGVDWKDPNSLDDIMPNEIHLVKGKEVLIRIGARDVLHSFYLPHFRVKMDAVPGMPTQFKFTPTKTTAEMRKLTGKPDFNYELACAELCGSGHYGMKALVIVEEEDEYNAWMAKQVPYYTSVINPPAVAPVDSAALSTATAPADSVKKDDKAVNSATTNQ